MKYHWQIPYTVRGKGNIHFFKLGFQAKGSSPEPGVGH